MSPSQLLMRPQDRHKSSRPSYLNVVRYRPNRSSRPTPVGYTPTTMKYRRLGKTGLRVSVVGMGTWQFGGEWGKDFTPGARSTRCSPARDLGINLIDTAECYGDHSSEQLDRPRRRAGSSEQVDHRHQVRAPVRTAPWTAPSARPAGGRCSRQLGRLAEALQTDYVDLSPVPLGERRASSTTPSFGDAQEAGGPGKVRHIGNSIGPNDNLHQAERSAQATSRRSRSCTTG